MLLFARLWMPGKFELCLKLFFADKTFIWKHFKYWCFLDLCDEGQPTVPAHAHRGMFKYEDPLWACDLCFWQWSILQQQQGIFHWFWRVIWGNIWKLTLEINLNFANNVTLHFLESKLGTHVKTHSGDKSYFCKQCDFALILASNLRMHMKTHTGDKS